MAGRGSLTLQEQKGGVERGVLRGRAAGDATRRVLRLQVREVRSEGRHGQVRGSSMYVRSEERHGQVRGAARSAQRGGTVSSEGRHGQVRGAARSCQRAARSGQGRHGQVRSEAAVRSKAGRL